HTDGEGQEQTQARGEPPQSAPASEAETDGQEEQAAGEAVPAGETASEPGVESAGNESLDATHPPDETGEPSQRVGPYIVDRGIGGDTRQSFVAHQAPDVGTGAHAPRLELLVESASAEEEAVEQLVALQLDYQRLLVPHALVQTADLTLLA